MDVSANELRITDYSNVKNLQVSIKKNQFNFEQKHTIIVEIFHLNNMDYLIVFKLRHFIFFGSICFVISLSLGHGGRKKNILHKAQHS